MIESATEVGARAPELESLLRARLRNFGSLIVAFSGGVDSTYLAWVAQQEAGRVLCVTGDSRSLADAQRRQAVALAGELGFEHRLLSTAELEDPRYLANAPDRCYFCKTELYGALTQLARSEGYAAVVDGTNADDARDVRPGRRAASEHGVGSPLLETGLGKEDIRWLSQRAGLRTWDAPASPCLSSRIPHGSPVDEAKLAQIEAGEEILRLAGFRELRLRHHGEVARIEVGAAELARLTEPELRERLARELRALGFRFVAVDLEPFASGRLSASPKLS